MQNVEAVPAVLDHAERQRRLGGERQHRRPVDARDRAGAEDEHRLRLVGRRMLGEGGERLRAGAEIIVAVGQVGLLADDADQAIALQPALADAGVEHRRFEARIRADDHDRVGLVDAGDRRIEQIGGAAELRIELGAVLAAIDARGAELVHQPLEGEHFLDAGEIADDRADARRLRRLGLGGDRGEGLAPGRRLQLALDPHVRPIEPLGLEAVDDMAGLVGDPLLVHRLVDARQDAHDFAAARVDADRRPQRVHHVDRLGLHVFPRPRMERGRLARSARRPGRDRRHCPAARRSARVRDRS